MEKEKPEKVFSAGGVRAAIFRNERMVKGVGMDIPSISFQKRYKDGEDWKSTSVLDVRDLPRAILVLSKAYDYLESKTHNNDEDLVDLS